MADKIAGQIIDLFGKCADEAVSIVVDGVKEYRMEKGR